MTDFAPGFVSRHQAAAEILQAAFAPPPGFAEFDITARARRGSKGKAEAPRPKSFAPEAPGPRHFTPADPDKNPTEGWDPLTPEVQPAAEAFIDPIAAARQAGYAEGLAAAHEEMAQERARNELLMARLAEALHQGVQFDRERIARQLRSTIMMLVARLVSEAGIDGELLGARVAAAVDMLADSAESAVLHLNPADVPLVDGHLPKTLFPVADPAVERGGFVLESPATIIEDSPEQWLTQLAQAIDRIGVPPLC